MDLVLRNARLLGRDDVVDVGIAEGRVQALRGAWTPPTPT